ncbi:MAG: hypothetical protein JEZ07_16210 [Phycisphaerae bacterium]|nr:hypothetical protein [Phycisphaerae bacterium]
MTINLHDRGLNRLPVPLELAIFNPQIIEDKDTIKTLKITLKLIDHLLCSGNPGPLID